MLYCYMNCLKFGATDFFWNGYHLQTRKFKQAGRNVLKTLLCVTIVHVFCWTPNQLVYIASHAFGVDIDRNGVVYNISIIAVYLNCCVNPLVYMAFYTAFKKDVTNRFSCWIQPSTIAFL